MQHRGLGGNPRMGWFFEADHDPARPPRNAEPDKCSELAWIPLDALPDDMVAYCRAGLDVYRAGQRFLIHWHEDGDTVAYAPGPRGAPSRCRWRRPPPAGCTTSSCGAPDLAEAEAEWGWLLGELGHVPYQRWAHGRSWRRGDTYVVVERSPDLVARTHERLRPGLDHLAFHIGDRATLDALVARAPGRGWRLLFPDRHPYAGGSGHYAAYLENTAGFEVELVAP